jgi:nicotinate-nucleotide pyrophosphorylase
VKRVPFEPLDPGVYRELVRRALAEDFGWGDVTTEGVIDAQQKARAVILGSASEVRP